MYDVNRSLGELQPESFAFAGEFGATSFLGEEGRPFSEAEEMELAAELLAVSNDAELEQFLGKLFKKAWKGIKTIGSKVLKPLGGVLKTVAKAALPMLATAAGTFFGGPAGGAIGGKLGSLVSQALEAETAASIPGDRDFEKCRQFVRMAGIAAKAAASAPPGADPVMVARKSLTDTARLTIAKTAPASPMAGAMTKPTLSPGLQSVPPALRSTPGPEQRAFAGGARPVRTSGIAGKPAASPTAPLGFEPIKAPRPAGSAIRQPQPSTGRQALGGSRVGRTACSCGKPNCTCRKCREARERAREAGRWVRRGRSIVIINC